MDDTNDTKNRWLVRRIELWERALLVDGETEEEAIQNASDDADISTDSIKFVGLSEQMYWKVEDLYPARVISRLVNLLVLIQTTLSVGNEHKEIIALIEESFLAMSNELTEKEV